MNHVLVLCVFVFIHVKCDEGSYGVLTADCAANYYRLFVTRRVPPRNYRYYHEVLAPSTPEDYVDESGSMDTDMRWRIVGGRRISITQAPYQVLYGMYCGGTLIAPEWVMTAAHCKEKETFVIAGSTQRSKGTHYPICAHFTHPLWKNNTKLHSHDYDYQLVLLERPVPVTPSSRPIAIGDLSDLVPGRMVGISGWGHLKFRQSKMQDFLYRVYVPIMSNEECRSLPLTNYHRITDRMFCAGFRNGSKDSCQGDSGGPAVVNGKLIGLVSFGVGCAIRDQPGVYSNIPLVRDWIRQVTALPL